MSNSLTVFQNLGVLAECVEKTEKLDMRFHDAVARNRNIPQCPAGSLSALKELSAECQELVNDSHKLYHSLNTSAMWNSNMMKHSEKILQYMERGVEKYMKSHGLTALGKVASENNNLQLTGHKNLAAEPSNPVKTIFKSAGDSKLNKELPKDTSSRESDTRVMAKKDIEDASALLKSPVLPPILKHYRSRSDSFCSPQDPLNGKFTEGNADEQNTSSHLLCNAMNLESPQLRAFNRPTLASEVETPPYGGYYFNGNLRGKGDLITKGQSNSFFDPIQSPQLKVDIRDSPDLTLHCRRSILAQPPRPADDDDDTVYRLFSRGQHQAKQPLESPPSPNLGFHKNIPPTGRGKDDYYVLPSPEMPADIFSDRNANFPRSRDYEICQSKYDTLPNYVKRIIPLPNCNECLKNVMSALVSLQGYELKKVTTEDTVAEVTLLGWKTKSFIFILKTLGIMKEIKGTSYYEILV